MSTDPRITYAIFKLQDVLEEQKVNSDPDYAHITKHKSAVLKRFQPVFHPDHLPQLSKAEFESFLLYRNNHHWDSLHRVGKHMVSDMPLLREAMAILVDENRPVEERLNELRPERYWGEHAMIPYLGMPVLTAVLQVMYPEKYGVWNNTSDAGMKLVRLWDKNWEKQPAGDSYIGMNAIYLDLCQGLNVDLWTLDALWWVVKKKESK